MPTSARRIAAETLLYDAAEHGKCEIRRVQHQVGGVPQNGRQAYLGRNPIRYPASRRQRMPPARFGEPAQQARLVGLHKDKLHAQSWIALQAGQSCQNLVRIEPPTSRIDADRRRPLTPQHHVFHQTQRRIIDCLVAEILEHAQRRCLART